MSNLGRAVPFVLAVLLALASGVAGFAIGHIDREPTPTGNTNEAVLAEVRALAEQIARLQARIAGGQAAAIAPPAAPASREPAANAPDASSRGEPMDEDRLRRLVLAAITALPRGDDNALRQARLQNPQPNVAAVTDLHARLLAATGQEQEAVLRAQQREWWLLGMADVVRRLGMPDELREGDYGQIWTYHLSDDRTITVFFQSGVVVRIDI